MTQVLHPRRAICPICARRLQKYPHEKCKQYIYNESETNIFNLGKCITDKKNSKSALCLYYAILEHNQNLDGNENRELQMT